jgi:hypothetical protein
MCSIILFIRRYCVMCWLLFCLPGLFGCVEEYDENGKAVGDDELVPLRLGSLFITDGTVSSRSGSQTLNDGDLGIFLYAGQGYSETRNNVHYRCTGGTWSVPDAGGPIYLTRSTANLCAYYPYSSADDYADGMVTLTSQRYSGSADLCYKTGITASSASGPVSFTMNHAYAKWVFNFTRDASYTGTCAVSQIKIAHADVISSNTLNMLTGQYGTPDAGSKGSVMITDVGISGIASGETQTVSVLMVPALSGASLSGDITLTFTVDGKEMTTTVSPSQTCLAAGNQYVLNVTIANTPTVTNTANSYIIAPYNRLRIPVNIKGNGGDVAGTGLSVTHTAASVGILWQTSPNLIALSDFSSSDQKVKITAGSSSGNAVIAAYDGPNATGNILWSWHIWVTDYNPDSSPVLNGNVYNHNGFTWMDRNLGATTATPANVNTLGLLYQWGRKDPFPGPSNYKDIPNGSYNSLPIYNASGTLLTEGTPTGGTGINSVAVSVVNNLNNSILHPMTFYCCVNPNESVTTRDWYTNTNDHTYQNDALWGSSDPTAATLGSKTIFDPCPPGWRVPAWINNTSPWKDFTVDTFPWSNYGRIYTATDTFYPAAGYRYSTTGALTYVGEVGNLWSASACASNTPFPVEYSHGFHFTCDVVNSLANNWRAPAYSVRCVRE